jgi:acetylornithine deacetylase/succinyl-diaminopimelate desuccinylase-like protein
VDETAFVFPLFLALDASSLTMSLVTIGSPTGFEGPLADSVEAALLALPHLNVERIGNTVVARTDDGRDERVLVAGHLGTSTGNADDDPVAYVEMGKLHGPGAADVKGGLTVMLKAATLAPTARGRDVTFVFYDDVSVLAEARPDVLAADFAVVLQPLDAGVAATPDTLHHPLAQRMVALTELPVSELTDGTDVAVLERLDIPAVGFGPGGSVVAGTPGEFVRTAELTQCEFVLRELLK